MIELRNVNFDLFNLTNFIGNSISEAATIKQANVIDLGNEELNEFMMKTIKNYDEELEDLFDFEAILKNYKFDLLTQQEGEGIEVEEGDEEGDEDEEGDDNEHVPEMEIQPKQASQRRIQTRQASNTTSDSSIQTKTNSTNAGVKYRQLKSPRINSPASNKRNIPVMSSVTIDLINNTTRDSNIIVNINNKTKIITRNKQSHK